MIYNQSPQGLTVVGESVPNFPADFNRFLQLFDRDLWVTWHRSPHSRKPGRWKIERCLKHHAGYALNGTPEHTYLCQRVYILMVQDAEGVPMPLGEHVINKLREMRSNWESLGGDTERGVKNALAASDAIEGQLEARRELATADMIEHNQKDKKNQFNKLYDLIDRHDMRPNR